MVKTIRKIGRRVNFNSETKGVVLKGEDEIRKVFSEIKIMLNRIKKIQSKLKSSKIKIKERKNLIKEKRERAKKMVNLWNSLTGIDANNLKKEEFVKIINSQKNFINDLLGDYSN